MGKKAKKRKERKEFDWGGDPKNLEPNEFEGQMVRYTEDPDWQLVFMDPHMPIWMFMNDKTNEIASIGERQACLRARLAFKAAVEQEWFLEHKKKRAA